MVHTAPFQGQRKKDIPPSKQRPCPGTTHLSASSHTSLQFKASLHCVYTQWHLLPFELTKPFPSESTALRVPRRWSRTGREPCIFFPQPIISLVLTQACAAASRSSSSILAGVKSTVAHSSPAASASHFLLPWCSPASEMDIALSRAGSPQQEEVCPGMSQPSNGHLSPSGLNQRDPAFGLRMPTLKHLGQAG